MAGVSPAFLQLNINKMNNNKTTEINLREYQNTEAEKLNASIPPKVLENATKTGRRDGEESLPKSMGDDFLLYLLPLFQMVQSFIDTLRSLHKADESIRGGLVKLKKELQDQRNERDEIEEEKNEVKREVKKIKSAFPKKLAVLIAIVVLLLGLMEGAFSIGAISSFIANLFMATAVSLVYGLGLSIIAHYIPKWWNMGNKTTKYLIRFTIITGFSLVFFFFGLLRSYQVFVSTATAEMALNGGALVHGDYMEALMYTLLSWIIFLPACILSKMAPTKQQWIGLFKLTEKKKELKKLEDDLLSKKKEITQTKEDYENLKQWDYTRLKTAQKHESQAIGLLDQIKANYIQSNIRTRYGDQQPDCFKQELNFELKTYFQDLTNYNETNNN